MRLKISTSPDSMTYIVRPRSPSEKMIVPPAKRVRRGSSESWLPGLCALFFYPVLLNLAITDST
jgi:hypothetical protein